MKKLLWLIPLMIAVAAASAAAAPARAASPAAASGAQGLGPAGPGAELDMDYCTSYLAAYGSWIRMDPWGAVWCPRNMGYRWRPYSDGHWVWTDFGWTWISDLEWGWMPFHYGRWGWDDDIGWFWVPGYAWGPAWVAWRTSDFYFGWAPCPPGMEFRAGLDFGAFGTAIPWRFWIFIGGSHFMDDDIYPNVLPFERNLSIISLTMLNNHFIFQGPNFINIAMGLDVVRNMTRRDIPRYRLSPGRQPGMAVVSGTEIQMFRPSFKGNAAVAPKTVLDKTQASAALSTAKIFEPREKPPRVTTEADVLQRQAVERKLLEDSHSQEMKSLGQAKDQGTITQITKQHQVETKQLTDRHASDAAKVRQFVTTHKTAPPDKKK